MKNQKVRLLENQNQAMEDLFNEFDFLFTMIKQDMETECSLRTMRLMLMIDVFVNQLKNTFYNYTEEEK